MEERDLPKVTCLVPTYNEELRIKEVLMVLSALRGTLLDQIIVIDDGSKDKTREIVHTFPEVELIPLDHNRGKSFAVAEGLRRAKNEFIFMCDGDLIGLQKETVSLLVEPVRRGTVAVTMSYRDNTPKWWIRLFRVETFTGERCFRRSLLEACLDRIAALPGYGLETYMNKLYIEQGLSIGSVRMQGVTIEFKWHKHGWLVGIYKELLMWRQIRKVTGLFSLAGQVMRLRRLARFL